MKKFVSISIGVIIGIAVSAALIYSDKNRVAYSEEGVNWWNNLVSTMDSASFDWNDVFNPLGPSEKGKNLYNLVYKKLTRDAGKDALTQVSKNFGLTPEEARAAINGSLTTILNNENRRSTGMSQATAAKIVADLQSDYADLSELYQIQQEVDTLIAPSEIFSNGDLSDSGFDLINDLAAIEEILFVEKSPVTVGGVYEEAYKSPFNPTEDQKQYENYVANETDVAELPLVIDSDGKVGVIKIGDKEVEAEMLDHDDCEEDNGLANAINDFNDKNGGGGGEGDVGGGGEGDGDDGGGEGAPEDIKPQTPTTSAPKGNWAKQWCPGYEEPGVFAGVASKFNSLGGVGDNYIAGGAASANFESKAFSANMGVCFDIKAIKKKIATYLPGATCILCEVEKINLLLDKTLSHTLIPNKATGNLMESAKCKKAAMVPLINLQFILIWNPVPTPINDKLIFGRNLFESWNEFTEKYQPILLSKDKTSQSEERHDLTDQFNLELLDELSSGKTSQADMYNKISRIKAEAAAQAAADVDKSDVGNDIANDMTTSRILLQEIKQMNALFKNFKDTYALINTDALQEIIKKSNVQ